MPLSRLDNFLKNARGNILYVNPNDLDATDSIENQGNSLARPFKTIQRALVEAARFSYQAGLDNDRFGQTTILLYPGEHLIDNRPGWIPIHETTANTFQLRNGTTSTNFSQFDLTTNFDLTTDDNALYKLNSIHGGVILPRGTSIVGLDLRKTKIRPRYVPNPSNDNIERSAIFRLTGISYLWQFTLLDGDPNGVIYKDYTSNTFVPNFSHHKLTCFEYADGVNPVKIDDAFLTYTSTRTDLEMYYEKVGLAYGPSSGREVEPDYPASGLDIQPKIDEYRIVGPKSGNVGITSIKAGDGTTSSTTITVTTDSALDGIAVDTAFQVNGITASGYNGQYVVSDVVSSTEFKYAVSAAPTNALPTPTGGTVTLNVDTVTSASPYIFNISLRSVFGMCGVHADGDKATGFKSMVIAQFTGIGLQKDDNAFVKYDTSSGTYKDSTTAGNENLHSDSLAVYKPEYSSFHIKCSNNAILQIVSVFAIGFAEHFVADTGGDQSITNSNSNFGSKSLIAKGFRNSAFSRDDVGYITHIIPPKQLSDITANVEFNAIDVAKTVERTIGAATTDRLYLYNQTNSDVAPDNVIEGYRIGAREGDRLKTLISESNTSAEYSARIIVPNTGYSGNEVTSEKSFNVGRSSVGVNSISSDTITLQSPHNFIEGESIRVLSDTAQLPDGVDANKIYYAITSGLNTDQVRLAKTLNDALAASQVTINSSGGRLKIVSRVSDKNSGDIGHPIQYDTTENQWYINVATAATDNNLSTKIVSLGTTSLGAATPRTFISRTPDTRNLSDTIYKLRYVIPSGSGITSARPPADGYVLQESSDVTGSTDTEVESYFSPTVVSLSNVNEQRNFRFIANAIWDGSNAVFETELPHNLSVGSVVEISNVTTSSNSVGIGSSAFNNTFTVTGISSSKSFTVPLGSDPGTFTNDTSNRTTSLPTFKRKRYNNTYYLYRSQEVQKYIAGEQDGIYHLVVLNSSNAPSVAPFTGKEFSQPVQFLYPQTDRDTPKSDPDASVCFAAPTPVGNVIVDEPRHSLTKETVNKKLVDDKVGFGITDIVSVSAAGTSHIIHTTNDIGLNRITKVSIAESGTAYGSGSAATLYNARLVGFAGSVTGDYATAAITVDAIGGITAVQIMDGGSAYGIGNTLAVVGVATTTGHVQGYVTVDDVYNNVGDSLRIIGVSSNTLKDYNQLYRISEVNVGAAKSFVVSSASTVGNPHLTGTGSDLTSSAFGYLTGEALRITSFTYDSVSGIATVVTSQNHGLKVDNVITLSGATNDLYNKEVVVTKNTSLTEFVVNLGVSTNSPTVAGTQFAIRNGISANSGNITVDNENVGGRQVLQYAGITTTLSAVISNASTTSIELQNIDNLDVKIGDYLEINDEIVRVKTKVTGNPVSVFRGVLGTKASSHAINTVVRRVHVTPVELRRNSILRASGHTFEYVGYGPGNYSTALPETQDRQLSIEEEFLAQSTKTDGGIVVYTGMNDQGDFYIGNKKVSSATGEEEVFDAPIPTVTGEDVLPAGISIGFDVLSPLEVTISRSLRVEGGPDNNIISEFDGPVVFNDKVTSTSTKGFEASSIFIQGDATISRKYTVGIATPSLAGNPGDVVYNSNPAKSGYIGWVYTTDNDWYRFGNISISKTANINLFDQVGVGTTSIGSTTFQVGSGSSSFSVNSSGQVGLGTTSTQGYTMYVNGNVFGTFVGDGSGLTNLDSIWEEDTGGTFIYDKDDPNHFVGIGTSIGITAQLQIAGTAATSLYVTNGSRFISTATFESEVSVGGTFSSSKFALISTGNTDGRIKAGVTTSNIIHVGTSGTVFNAILSTGNVGVGTSVARSKFDVEGRIRYKTIHGHVGIVTSVSNVVTLDLSRSQNFTLTLNEKVDSFTITNIPNDASEFTIKIVQDSTGGHNVGLDTFKTSGGSDIPVFWPGGGVLPGITTTASRADIYSYKTFDGGSNFYGVVVGQNFVN